MSKALLEWVFVYVGNPKLYKYALLTGHGKHPEIRFYASVTAMFYKKKHMTSSFELRNDEWY